jgi:hypothetical protein
MEDSNEPRTCYIHRSSLDLGAREERKRPRFIRLRRKPGALPVDECVSGICTNPEPGIAASADFATGG